MRFQQSGKNGEEAGWSCACGNLVSLRQATKEALDEQRRMLTERRVNVVRTSMKVRARAHRLMKHSERLAERQREKK